MLSDEEKKAIEYLKRHILPFYGRKGTIEFILNDTILNLIEKQSKEIEELKNENKIQSDCEEPIERTEEMVNMNWVNHNYIGKDKIKAKIEEYENKIKKIRNKKLINEPEDTIIITRYAHYISVLQSLLEKE